MRQVVLLFVHLSCPQRVRRLGKIYAYTSVADCDRPQQNED